MHQSTSSLCCCCCLFRWYLSLALLLGFIWSATPPELQQSQSGCLPACLGAEFTGGFCMPQSTDGCRSYCLSTAAFWQVHLLRLHASIRFYNAVETLNALKTLSKHRLEKGKENERERGILSFPSGGPECFCFCCCCSLSIQRHSFEFLFPSSVMKLN